MGIGSGPWSSILEENPVLTQLRLHQYGWRILIPFEKIIGNLSKRGPRESGKTPTIRIGKVALTFDILDGKIGSAPARPVEGLGPKMKLGDIVDGVAIIVIGR